MEPVKYKVILTISADKDSARLTPQLRGKFNKILEHVLTVEPHIGKKLIGDLRGSYSLRLSYQDRIVYRIDTKKKIVHVDRAKSHYDN